MQVTAFATRADPDWRWRIVNYAGETIEESHETFPTIATAVKDGRRRLEQMNVTDLSEAPRSFRSTSHLRGRPRGRPSR